MEKRNITITLDKAKEWYNSDNTTLKDLALQAFSRDEIRTTRGGVERYIFNRKLPNNETSDVLAGLSAQNRRRIRKSIDQHTTKSKRPRKKRTFPFRPSRPRLFSE